MAAKDALEVLIEVLDSQAAQFVEGAPHLHPVIAVRITPMPGRYQPPTAQPTDGPQLGRVVVRVAQDVAHVRRQLVMIPPQQPGCRSTGGDVSGCEFRRQRDPNSRDYCQQMQFPAVNPTMPATLRPVGLSIDGSMRHFAQFPMLLVHTPPLARSTVLSAATARP